MQTDKKFILNRICCFLFLYRYNIIGVNDMRIIIINLYGIKLVMIDKRKKLHCFYELVIREPQKYDRTNY